MNEFLPSDNSSELWTLAHQMSSPEPAILAELRRETHLKVLYPQMLSSPLQGRMLSFFSHLLRPTHILEVGTYTGYSCLCLAEGLAPEGRMTTIEVNPERASLIQRYLHKQGIADRVDLEIGPALDILPKLTDLYDLIFLDADKAHYPDYLEQCFPLLAPHGMLIADNVLWHGKVLDLAIQTKEVKGIRKMLDLVKNHEHLEQVFLPLWDGWLLVRKQTSHKKS